MLPWHFLFVVFVCVAGLSCGEDGGSDSSPTDDSSGNDSDDDDTGDDGDKPNAMKDAGKTPAKDAGTTPPKDAGGVKPDAGETKDAGTSGGLDSGTPRDAGTTKDAGTTPPPNVTNATQKTVSVGGTNRTYLVYIPSSVTDSKAALPFVSVHHGFTMTGTIMSTLTSWRQIAEREKFVVVFPDGGGGSPWNVGTGVCNVGQAVSAPETQDDFGFLKAMVAETKKTQAINEAQIFVGGFSMGGYFANNVACKMSDYVRATSAHSGGTYTGSCPGKRVPMLIIHGDSDTLIPYACGTDAHGYWVERNGCSSDTTSETIKKGSCKWNKGCPAGQEVGICTLNGMDHGWAGATYTGPWLTLQYGGGVEYENAAEMMWTFFKKYL